MKNLRIKKIKRIGLKGSSMNELFIAIKDVCRSKNMENNTLFLDVEFHQHRNTNGSILMDKSIRVSLFLSTFGGGKDGIKQFNAPNGDLILSKMKEFLSTYTEIKEPTIEDILI